MSASGLFSLNVAKLQCPSFGPIVGEGHFLGHWSELANAGDGLAEAGPKLI
jgi:hypothetical protein